MSKVYFIIAFLGIYTLPFLEKNPFELPNPIQILQDGKHTYYIIPQAQLDDSQKLFSIKEIIGDKGGLTWGKETASIKERVDLLRDESSMFNQIVSHLEASNYPYLIENTCLENAYGSFSSSKGEVKFEVDKMKDYIFDATIIEEFVHAYQALYYNYSHSKLKMNRKRTALLQGKKISQKNQHAGLINWKKFGNKHAFIESEAKLITYIIQHETCSIPVRDIIATDQYNTGGKGHKILSRYFKKRRWLFIKRNKRMGHLHSYFVDINTFVNYQQKFIHHWRKKDPKSIYTKGYFYHKPEALNHVYAPLTLAEY